MQPRLTITIPAGSFLQIAVDALLISTAYVLACYLVLNIEPAVYLLHESGIWAVAFVALTILIGMNISVSGHSPRGAMQLAYHICLVVGIAFLIEALMSYLVRALRLPVHVMLAGSVFAGAALFAERLAVGWIRRRDTAIGQQERRGSDQ